MQQSIQLLNSDTLKQCNSAVPKIENPAICAAVSNSYYNLRH